MPTTPALLLALLSMPAPAGSPASPPSDPCASVDPSAPSVRADDPSQAGASEESARPAARLESLQCIWKEAPHNAFTDLVRFEGRFLCAFREGRGHVSTDGRLRVLASTDGLAWQPIACLRMEGVDLRDANLSVTPEGQLMLVGGAARREEDGQPVAVGTVMALSNDGSEWSEPRWIVEPGRWMWRAHWHLGRAYGVSYSAGDKRRFLELHASRADLGFEIIHTPLFSEGRPSEAALESAADGALLCLVRRDLEDNSAWFGRARAPYTDWEFHDLGVHVGGPALRRLPDGRLIVAGRRIDRENEVYETVLHELDESADAPALRELLVLPSGGDTSYPGLVWHAGKLYVSYYSSHEGEQARIWFARVAL